MDAAMSKTIWPRIVLGFIIAPLVVPLTYYVFSAATRRTYDASHLVGSLLTYGVYSYLVAIVFGIPAFLLLRKNGYTGLWSCVLTTGTIGLIGAGMMFFIGLKPEGVLVGAIAGMLAGVVFYFIALF